MISNHYEEMLRFYGAALGGRVARKHLGWYMDEAATPAALRREVLTTRDPVCVLRLIEPAILDGQREAA
jgi:tRNA-dihydrouridine synthase